MHTPRQTTKSRLTRRHPKRLLLANHVSDTIRLARVQSRPNLPCAILYTDYDRILRSEFGQQARHFYTQTSNNIKSVHEEASRIAADKKQATNIASGSAHTLGSTGAASSTTADATTAGTAAPLATSVDPAASSATSAGNGTALPTVNTAPRLV